MTTKINGVTVGETKTHYVGDLSLLGWNLSAWEVFLKEAVNPLPELKEGGCGRLFIETFSDGGVIGAIAPSLDGGPGTGPDDVIKQGGAIAAAQYVVNNGLVVPLRSPIYRAIVEGTETAASSFVLADAYTRIAQGYYAEYNAHKAGRCR